ncbi:MAG: flagellar hook-basal body complex protein [Clostridiales bacterium]|nr:flagellar hook-basal body complex protein [Clostridiales bacterium]
MMRSLFSAVSGLRNHQTAMDIIGNNIANVNTTAYKASSVIFSDIYSQTLSEATGAYNNAGGSNAKQVGLGMEISSIRASINEGSSMSTGNTLDFSISGEGYFIVKASDGNSYYTRNGAFSLDDVGNLVTQTGNYVMGVMIDEADIGATSLTDFDPENDTLTNIVIDRNFFSSYSIDGNGIISAVVKATSYTDAEGVDHMLPADVGVGDEVQVGRVTLATFVNAAGLKKEGDSLYSVSTNSGDPLIDYANEDAASALKAGSLEMSNVDLATELTNMIIMQRGFQANSRVITTSDTMLEELVNLKRS